MRKLIVCVLFFLAPAINKAGDIETNFINEASVDSYVLLKLADMGLSKDVFDLAIKGLVKLKTNGKLPNSNIVTIADYSQSSNKKRLYVIDLENRKLLFNTYVAHGRNTGDEFAKSFSNEAGSLKSSLGFFVTGKCITGSHTGYSLMINGVEKGVNDNACKREIIIHAADYATESFIKKNGRLGRSLGCPVLPPDLNEPIIETIKGGTCLFIYNPDNKYLCSSSLLN
ncbi:MAG TPA: murein L,D-transpeptidase catalytic domain family protein [Prolixibacteraceae bacterium]|nr:murein L,D-transpeptidase catalytic domain family protein [Prolixibacteraceae bacterium]